MWHRAISSGISREINFQTKISFPIFTINRICLEDLLPFILNTLKKNILTLSSVIVNSNY